MQGLIEKRSQKVNFDPPAGKIKQMDIFYVRPYPYLYQLFSVSLNQGSTAQNTKKITCPVLVLHGTEDKIMPLYAAKLTPGVFPHASFKAFKGYGHAMVFSHGKQIAKTILGYF
jgi:pimeloyl-ACP methyl ester carboxylesterase